MIIKPRKTSHPDELWNVSFLPTVTAAPSAVPPHGPTPSGGRALQTPALLSLSEGLATEAFPEAA